MRAFIRLQAEGYGMSLDLPVNLEITREHEGGLMFTAEHKGQTFAISLNLGEAIALVENLERLYGDVSDEPQVMTHDDSPPPPIEVQSNGR